MRWSEMVFCPKCGKPNPEQVNYCSFCGATLPKAVTTNAQIPEKTKTRKFSGLTVALVILCVVSIATTIGVTAYCVSKIASLNSQISSQNSKISSLNSQISDLNSTLQHTGFGVNNQVQVSGTVLWTNVTVIQFSNLAGNVTTTALVTKGSYSVVIVGGQSYNIRLLGSPLGYQEILETSTLYVPSGVTTFHADF